MVQTITPTHYSQLSWQRSPFARQNAENDCQLKWLHGNVVTAGCCRKKRHCFTDTQDHEGCQVVYRFMSIWNKCQSHVSCVPLELLVSTTWCMHERSYSERSGLRGGMIHQLWQHLEAVAFPALVNIVFFLLIEENDESCKYKPQDPLQMPRMHSLHTGQSRRRKTLCNPTFILDWIWTSEYTCTCIVV
jgi:hypothetical protein